MKNIPPRPIIRLKIVIVAVSVLILSLVGAVAYVWLSENPIYPSYDPNRPTAAQQKAIDDAMEWRTNSLGAGAHVITPAVHPETGARYGFTDSNIPPGWEPVR